MSYIAKKQRLRAINFRECLGAFLLFAVGAGIGNARRQLSGNHIKKTSVADVQGTVGI